MDPVDDVRFYDQGEEFNPPAHERYDMAGMLIRWGLVSTPRQADYALIGIAAIFIIAAVLFGISFFVGNTAPPPPPIGV